MSVQTFTNPDSVKIAADRAGVYVRGLNSAGYRSSLFGKPKPGEFSIEEIDGGFRVTLNPLPGRQAVAA